MDMLILHIGFSAMYLVIALIIGPVARGKPNKWIGIRIPQTMEDERVWRDVHLASIPLWYALFVISGLLAVVTLLISDLQQKNWLWMHISVEMLLVLLFIPWSIAVANKSKDKWRKHDEMGINRDTEAITPR
jgi:uncharacterized membrane protein